MGNSEENGQFQLLEEKINSLIEYIGSSKKEKASLLEKVEIQEEKIADLAGELEKLKTTKENAKQRIASLLEKLERLDV